MSTLKEDIGMNRYSKDRTLTDIEKIQEKINELFEIVVSNEKDRLL